MRPLVKQTNCGQAFITQTCDCVSRRRCRNIAYLKIVSTDTLQTASNQLLVPIRLAGKVREHNIIIVCSNVRIYRALRRTVRHG